jgi:hypothetical protein
MVKGNLDEFRQGDVYFRKIGSDSPIDPKYKKVKPQGGKLLVALGVVTGHHHSVAADVAELFREPTEGDMVCVIKEATQLLHQTHGPITLIPGVYEIFIQTEYDPEGDRAVRD